MKTACMCVCVVMLYVIMSNVMQCDNMAREGLRTLVVAKKTLTEEQYADFEVCCQCQTVLKDTCRSCLLLLHVFF